MNDGILCIQFSANKVSVYRVISPERFLYLYCISHWFEENGTQFEKHYVNQICCTSKDTANFESKCDCWLLFANVARPLSVKSDQSTPTQS